MIVFLQANMISWELYGIVWAFLFFRISINQTAEATGSLAVMRIGMGDKWLDSAAYTPAVAGEYDKSILIPSPQNEQIQYYQY
jgi:hypothetical protein